MRFILRPIHRWPGRLRDDHESCRFTAYYSDTKALLAREAEHLGATEVVVQLGITEDDLRFDGELRANAKPSHPGVIVSFESRHGPLSYASDTFGSSRLWRGSSNGVVTVPGWQNNLRAVALSLEALRKVQRYGVAGEGQQYVGWRAIEAGGGPTSVEVAAGIMLSFTEWEDEDGNRAMVVEDDDFRSRVYREAAKATHPDAGGDPEDFRKVQLALEVLSNSAT